MSENLTGNNKLCSFNPATLEPVCEVDITDVAEVRSSVARARTALTGWSRLTLAQRLKYVERFRQVLYARKDEVADLLTRETGKPIIESFSSELFGALDTCKWLVSEAPKILADRKVSLNKLFFLTKKSYTVCEPLGVVAIISPWNYPFAIPVSSILSAITAGNTVVLKPSPKTPAVSGLIFELFQQAELPEHVLSVAYGDKDQAKALVEADVDRVVFTGSVAGGRAIMSMAAQKLHPVTLELGGKHPAIVLDDVDVERVAQALVWSAFTNCGQACASIERLYVHRRVEDELVRALARLTGTLTCGDGRKPSVDVGPLIDRQQLDRVAAMVERAKSQGARVAVGGRHRDGLPGFFYEPTLLVNVRQDMEIAREEIFGPVLPVIVFDDVEEAVMMANDSHLGLGASVWTADLALGERLARRIDAGMVWVNDGIYSHACPTAPWGGTKESGSGRTHSASALLDFTSVKYIGVDGQKSQDWHYPYNQERLDLVRGGLELLHGTTYGEKACSLFKTALSWLKTRR